MAHRMVNRRSGPKRWLPKQEEAPPEFTPASRHNRDWKARWQAGRYGGGNYGGQRPR